MDLGSALPELLPIPGYICRFIPGPNYRHAAPDQSSGEESAIETSEIGGHEGYPHFFLT